MSGQPLDNPYSAPQTKLQSPDLRMPVAARASLRAWLIVFLFNLPLPILLGVWICDANGHGTMVGMIALLLALSSWLVVAKPWLGDCMIDGGVLVAASQFLPFLHLMLAAGGSFFVEALRLYTPPPPPPPNSYLDIDGPPSAPFNPYSPAAMLFLTGFMGIGLMLCSFLLGLLPIYRRMEIRVEE